MSHPPSPANSRYYTWYDGTDKHARAAPSALSQHPAGQSPLRVKAQAYAADKAGIAFDQAAPVTDNKNSDPHDDVLVVLSTGREQWVGLSTCIRCVAGYSPCLHRATLALPRGLESSSFIGDIMRLLASCTQLHHLQVHLGKHAAARASEDCFAEHGRSSRA